MTQSDFLRLCATGTVPDGAPLRVEFPNLPPLAVYHIEGKFYVTDDTCTHANASLAGEGELRGFHIECTWHFGVFDVRTGEVASGPCTEPLKTWPVTVQDGAVYIRLD